MGIQVIFIWKTKISFWNDCHSIHFEIIIIEIIVGNEITVGNSILVQRSKTMESLNTGNKMHALRTIITTIERLMKKKNHRETTNNWVILQNASGACDSNSIYFHIFRVSEAHEAVQWINGYKPQSESTCIFVYYNFNASKARFMLPHFLFPTSPQNRPGTISTGAI